MLRVRVLLLAVMLLCLGLSFCGRRQTMFEEVSSQSSGIGFVNTLHKAPLFSILYYLYYYNGGGVSTGDINNDGLPDVFFTANHRAGNKLYLNKGNFQFEDITAKAGVAGDADWCTGTTMADVNGDGLLDIYVCAVSSQFGLLGKNALFINKGNLQFEDQAASYGLDFSGLSTQAAFFDYDHDGDLDCYLLNHSKKPHANVVDTVNRRRPDSVAGDRLYRNDVTAGGRRFTDVSASAGIYQSNLGYGLGLAIADFNNDGWEDIYVGNDFHENDYYYLNNKNGTFSESGAQHFGHYSRFSMGNDAADFDNDGQTDIVTVDMLPPDEKTLKTYGSDENPNTYRAKLTINGYQHQYSRNVLQRNNGNGESYSDVALLAGPFATDWSWCPLFADFDNDGKKDLFISSGIVKRPVDLDYVQFVSSMAQQKGLDMTDKFDEETIGRMPDGASHPFFFEGDGALKFDDVSEAWGTAEMKGYFNGAAYADFDNDGHLDVVINNINAPATLLRNRSTASAAISFSLKGQAPNTSGIGARLYVYQKGKMQYQQLMPTRGFQSSVEHRLHFGLDSAAAADSVLVVWPSQRCELLGPLAAGKTHVLDEANAKDSFEAAQHFVVPAPAMYNATATTGLQWSHRENDFNDFNRQYLLPHQQSTRGPRLAVADVNGDALEDIYVCGAAGQPGSLWLQQAAGRFVAASVPAFAANAAAEEVDALFADVNKDGHADLYVVSGGYEADSGSALLADHLYINDGRGGFAEQAGALPAILENKSSVAAADADGDGDIDLVVGVLAHPAQYGIPQNAYLLLNDGSGRFAQGSLPGLALERLGIITGVVFADINADRLPDLLVAGEWMPLTVFINKKGSYERQTVGGSSGWWQRLVVADANADGHPDVLAGNWGLNNKLVAHKDGPVKLYVKDFDKNGRVEQIVCYQIAGKEYTFLAKDELERALPVLKKAYLTYGEVAGETVEYMFYDLFKDYYQAKAENLASGVFVNDGKGNFRFEAFPATLQMAPLFAFASDSMSIWAGGNFYGTVPYEGRYDAQIPVKLDSRGKPMAQLPTVRGEMRDARWITIGGQPHLVMAFNNAPLQVWRAP